MFHVKHRLVAWIPAALPHSTLNRLGMGFEGYVWFHVKRRLWAHGRPWRALTSLYWHWPYGKPLAKVTVGHVPKSVGQSRHARPPSRQGDPTRGCDALQHTSAPNARSGNNRAVGHRRRVGAGARQAAARGAWGRERGCLCFT